MFPRAVVGLIVIVAIGGCTASPAPSSSASTVATGTATPPATSNGDFRFGPASPVPDARITFTVSASGREDAGCCKLVVENTGTYTLYGFPCRLAVFDRDGHVLYRGPVEPPPEGIGAPPGRSPDWGSITIPVRHPDRIASSHGLCEAWDWGPNGPPP
jgi:hypothetical protein